MLLRVCNFCRRKRGLDSIISKLKESAPDGSCDNPSVNPVNDFEMFVLSGCVKMKT